VYGIEHMVRYLASQVSAEGSQFRLYGGVISGPGAGRPFAAYARRSVNRRSNL